MRAIKELEESLIQEGNQSFISRKIKPNEIKYSTTEKEALAIKWCLEHLRPYVFGKQVTMWVIITHFAG